jgi:outer membrane receptor protein involved in Fe transport
VETPAHEVVDLSAGYAFGKGFDVVLSGWNLLDERYPLSPDADAPPAPGRSVGISLQARW